VEAPVREVFDVQLLVHPGGGWGHGTCHVQSLHCRDCSSGLWSKGCRCLSWRQPKNLLVDTSGEGRWQDGSASSFSVFTRYFYCTFTVPKPGMVDADTPRGSIVYTRDQLLNLRLCGGAGGRPNIPRELRRKNWGCRAGRRRWLKKRRYRPYLPYIVMGNVRSLVNKMDELTSLTRSESVFREGSVMCFTETWLHDNVPDMKKGGGVAVYVNNS